MSNVKADALLNVTFCIFKCIVLFFIGGDFENYSITYLISAFCLGEKHFFRSMTQLYGI